MKIYHNTSLSFMIFMI